MRNKQDNYLDLLDPPPQQFNQLDAMALIEGTVYKKLGEKMLPEIQLILAIMQSAAEEDDLEYFSSSEFEYHCFLIGLDNNEILELITRQRLLGPEKTKTSYNYRTIETIADKIKYQYEVEGLTQLELAYMYNVCTHTIRKLLNGEKLGPVKKSAEEKYKRIYSDYISGCSFDELKLKYNLGQSSIYRAINKISNNKY